MNSPAAVVMASVSEAPIRCPHLCMPLYRFFSGADHPPHTTHQEGCLCPALGRWGVSAAGAGPGLMPVGTYLGNLQQTVTQPLGYR